VLDYVRFVAKVIVHVDPSTRAGETQHQDGLSRDRATRKQGRALDTTKRGHQ